MFRSLIPALLLALFTSCAGNKPVVDPAPSSGDGAVPKDKRALVMSLFADATNARLEGDPAKAIQLYQATIKADPTNAASYFELAKLAHQAQHGDQALAFAKKAVAADGNNIWYRFLLADLSTQMGDLNGAAETYKAIIDQWPDHYEVYFGLADILAKQKKMDKAQQVYRDLEKRFGTTDELVMREYGMLVNANELDKARELLERAIAADPENPQYFGMLAEVYQGMGNKDKALEYFNKALAANPDDSMTRISLAQLYYDDGDLEKGFEQLKEAFSDPDLDLDPEMQLLLGFYQMTNTPQQSDSTTAVLIQQSHALIDELIKAHPESGKPWSLKGDFLMREKKPVEAREAFRKALEQEQDKFPIWSTLLQLDYQLKDWEALHTDAGKAAELFPTQPELHLYDGIALGQLKQNDQAIDALIAGRDLVVDNKPLEAQFWSLLGDSYNEAKDFTKSDEAYEKALAINPKDPSVLNNYAYYLSVRGEKLDKAAEMSRTCNEISPGVATYMDTYAWILYKQGKYADARTEQEKAIAAGGSSDGALLEHYGDILFRLDDTAGALEQWKKAQAAGGASEFIDRKVSEGHLVE